MDVSVSMRTRQLSTVLIEINGGPNDFFKMELSNGRVYVRYALQGETGIVFSGKTNLVHPTKTVSLAIPHPAFKNE